MHADDVEKMRKKAPINVPGMGPDSRSADKKVGSLTPYRCDLLPPLALLAVARLRFEAVQRLGEDGIDDWRWSDPQKHLNKVMAHVLAGLAGDASEGSSEEHMVHALCRLMFVVELNELERLSAAPVYGKPPYQEALSEVIEMLAVQEGAAKSFVSAHPWMDDLPPWACACVRKLVATRPFGWYAERGADRWNTIRWGGYEYVADSKCMRCGGTGHDPGLPTGPDANAAAGSMWTGDPVEDVATSILNTYGLSFHGRGDKDRVTHSDVCGTVARALGVKSGKE